MPCCGGGTGCNCKVVGGVGIAVTGIGSSNEPFEVSGDLHLVADDNAQFDIEISGVGTEDDPFAISVDYQPTAKLGHIPDVGAGATNGQVLAWNTASQMWVPTPPVTAAPGAISHDTSLNGDGSNPSPLAVKVDSARGMQTASTGVGLRDQFMNWLARRFNTAADRTAAVPAPVLNSLALLDTVPGRLDYYTGSAWRSLSSVGWDVQQVMLELSGPWAAGKPIFKIHKKIDTTVNASGEFTVLGTAELAGYSGVIVARFQSTNQHPPFFPVVFDDTGKITCTCYQLGDNNATLAGGTTIHGWCEALLY